MKIRDRIIARFRADRLEQELLNSCLIGRNLAIVYAGKPMSADHIIEELMKSSNVLKPTYARIKEIGRARTHLSKPTAPHRWDDPDEMKPGDMDLQRHRVPATCPKRRVLAAGPKESGSKQHLVSNLQVGPDQPKPRLPRSTKPKSPGQTNTFCPTALNCTFWPRSPAVDHGLYSDRKSVV